jgi:hypothetical protein
MAQVCCFFSVIVWIFHVVPMQVHQEVELTGHAKIYGTAD